MSRILTAKERNGLEKLTEDPISKDFLIKGQLTGVGHATLAALVELGLAETGPSTRYYGEMGWRITDDGWRCMYGRTLAEMSRGGPYHPLRVWRWPPQA